jgi:peptide/nickel transport system permease protein
MELRIFIVKRFLLMILTLFIIATIAFVLFRVMPGNPTAVVISPALDPEAKQALMHQFGLDKPLYVQYWLYISNLAQGDMGVSFRYREPVMEILWSRFINTLVLIGPAALFAMIIGLIMGGFSAARRATKLDSTLIVGSLAIKALPSFWTSMLALMLFAYILKWVPAAGMRTPGYEPKNLYDQFVNLDFLRHLILPLSIITLLFIAEPLLTMRNSMLETQGEDFIEMARAKGIGERKVVYKHWVRNALLPVVSIVPMMVGHIMGGEVLVETVFSWPGLGREIVNAVSQYDYPLAQASFFLLAVVVVGLNFLSDIAYAALDPRIRLE